MYAHLAQMLNLLVTPSSGPATVFTDGPVPDNDAMKEALGKVDALKFNVETGKVIRLVPAAAPDIGVTVVVEGGKEYKLGYLGHKPYTILAGKDIITRLGVEIEENPVMGEHVKTVDPLGSTNVKGVFVAGDAATPMKAVANAIGTGECYSRSWDCAAVDNGGHGGDFGLDEVRINTRRYDTATCIDPKLNILSVKHLVVEQSQLCHIVFGAILAYAGWRWVLRPEFLKGAMTDLMSHFLNYYLTRRYPIHHTETGQPIPGRSYRWPNGQGDEGKFLDGIENRAQWAKEHGRIYRIWAGTTPEVVLQTPEHIKLVFRDSDRHSKAVNNDSGYLMGEVLGQCLGLISGRDWRSLRGVCEAVFTHSKAIDYLDLIHSRVGDYLQQCSSLRHGTLDPVEDFKFLPFLIIGDILYGDMTREMEDELCSMAPLRERLFQFVIKGGLARYRWSQYLPTEANRALRDFRSWWVAFNQAAYRRARELAATATPVYQLFNAVDDGLITAENAYQTLDEMLFANLDVTLGGLSWNPVFLAANPDVQEELYENITTAQEAEGLVMPRYLQDSSTYLAACIRESSRLKPLAAFSVPQAAPTTHVLDGYSIPAGTNYVVDAYALNIEHEFWGPDRHEYRPGRFLGLKGADLRYHMWRFGFGPRQCLGKYVADLILRVFLVHLVRNWRLGFEDGQGADSEEWRRDLDTWITHPAIKLTCTPREVRA
ncbi:cytochrome P450 monooxygenase gliC [Aspergillus lucknowensis]|uniref:Cytochrome P450 n=1 Tax=Aspergillus lucknowensis TaxID=176173 RepID=A0ABR4LYM4_9EURO